MSLASTGFELVTKRTRKREFLDEMNLVIPWSELLSLIAPHAPAGKTGRPPFATEVMLRIHMLQQFFGHSDPAMEEALHDIPLSFTIDELPVHVDHIVGCAVFPEHATGADELIACDLSCLMHIAGRARRTGVPLRVRHIAEVLAG